MRLSLNNYDKHYLRVALPAGLEGIFMILLGNIDLILVGTLGTASIAAVSIFTQPRMMLLTVARSVAAAVTVLIAKRFGENRHEECGDILRKTLVLVVIFLGLAHVGFFVFIEDILRWMGAKDEYISLAMVYANWALIAVYLNSVMTAMQALLIGRGETMRVLAINIWGNIVKVILSAILIFGIGAIPALGVKGAAIGTVVGSLWSLVHTVIVLGREGIFSVGRFFPDRNYLREFMGVFSGIFSEQGFERVGMVLYTRMTAELGTVSYAVHAICMSFSDFFYTFSGGLGKASMVLAGHNGRPEKFGDWMKYLWTGIRWGVIFAMMSFLVTFIFREEIFSIYLNDPEIIPLGSLIMIFVAAVSFPEAQQMVAAGILRSSGKAMQVAAYSFVSITFLRPIITYIFLNYLQLGLAGAWLSLAIDQSIRAICATVLVYLTYRERKCVDKGELTAYNS